MKKYRSQDWFGKTDKDGFIHRSWMKNQGTPQHEFDGRPVIGICNTWSDLTPCNAHFRLLAERVKRAAGPAAGLTRAAFPAATILLDRWRRIYDMAKELQDDYARLAGGR